VKDKGIEEERKTVQCKMKWSKPQRRSRQHNWTISRSSFSAFVDKISWRQRAIRTRYLEQQISA